MVYYKKPCRCGCGGEVRGTNDYIKGHNRRGKVSFTSNGRWSMKYNKCRECGTTERKHSGQGYCSACRRKLIRRGILEKKRDLIGGKWSRKYDSCIDCGKVDRPYHSKGRCTLCYQTHLNRKKGMRERYYGEWSAYYKKCVRCGLTECSHVKKGLCYNCLEEVKREAKFKDSLVICPVCEVKVNKLQQHLAMKSHKCEKHLKLYNKYYNEIVSLFSTDRTSGQVSKEFDIQKRRVLNIWHENFTDTEIKSRGEKIRVGKISGENNYLYGSPFPPLNKDRMFPFEDINGEYHIMRSSWEVKYAEYLDMKEVKWKYEEHKFKYYDTFGRAHFYFPDFYLVDYDVFIEIKGYMDSWSEYKISECLKLHDIRIEVLKKKDLRALGIKI